MTQFGAVPVYPDRKRGDHACRYLAKDFANCQFDIFRRLLSADPMILHPISGDSEGGKFAMDDADNLSEDPWDRSFKAAMLLSAPLVAVVAAAGWAAVGTFDGRVSMAKEYPIKLAVMGLPMHVEAVMVSTGRGSQPVQMTISAHGLPTAPGGAAPTQSTDGMALDRGVRLAAVLPRQIEASPKTGFDNSSGLLVSDFNLGAGSNASNAIDVRKPVVLNGRAAGTVLIRIGAASQVYVRQSDLSALLTDKLAAAFSGGAEFITLDQIRDHGVKVHYDASKDELLIAT